MGPTRKRDLTAATVIAVIVGYVLVLGSYRWLPPITVLTGLSLLAVGAAEAAWAFYIRSKVNNGKIGQGPGRLHPLAVARSVTIAKASAWVGALTLGWWLAVLAYLIPRRDVQAAAENTAGAVVAAVSALVLVIAALWLQHCCKSPEDPPEDPDGVPE